MVVLVLGIFIYGLMFWRNYFIFIFYVELEFFKVYFLFIVTGLGGGGGAGIILMFIGFGLS